MKLEFSHSINLYYFTLLILLFYTKVIIEINFSSSLYLFLFKFSILAHYTAYIILSVLCHWNSTAILNFDYVTWFDPVNPLTITPFFPTFQIMWHNLEPQEQAEQGRARGEDLPRERERERKERRKREKEREREK